MSFNSSINKEDILNLPISRFAGDIILIDNLNDFDKYFNLLVKEKIWGFDTETRPSFKKGQSNQNFVSLLQLSSYERAILFRLNKLGFPEKLVNFLSDQNYLKVGLSIKDDLNSLKKITDFDHSGFVDLQNIVSDYGINEKSLRKLAAIVLQKRVSKAQQLTNWDAESLSHKQLVYAATDAWTCREIYLKLCEDN